MLGLTRKKYIVAILGLLAFIALSAESCADTSTQSKQRKESVKQRADTFARAENKYPLPHTENFPLRKMLVEMTKREDLENHPWYVYHMGDQGNVIGYYVAKTVPINACDFLSSTEDVHSSEYGKVVLHAPSIDGIYYGESACNTYVWQDYSTNAIVKVTLASGTIVTVDKPLNIEAEAIKVATKS